MGKYQGYDKYKDSGVEWLGDVPEHWEVKSLRHICEFLNRRRIPLSSEHRGSMSNKIYPYYGASGIIDYVEDFIFNEPTILIAEDGANLLSRSTPLAFIADGEYWVNNHAHILKPFLGEFGYWANLLCIIKYDNWITGSAQPKLTKDNLASIKLPTPPLDEQEKIARFLDYKTKQIDELIAKKETLIEKLDEKRTALITHAVTKGLDVNVPMKDSGIEWLGEIPKHWEVVAIKRCFDIRDGTHDTPLYVEEGEGSVPLITSKDFENESINFQQAKLISISDHQEIKKRSKVDYGDVLMSMIGGNIGKSLIVKTHQEFSIKNVALFKANNNLELSKLLLYYLASGLLDIQISLKNRGGAQGFLSLNDIRNLVFFKIPNSERATVVNYLDRKTAEIEEQKTKIQQAIDILKEYRTALITSAVTGKIDVRKIPIPC